MDGMAGAGSSWHYLPLLVVLTAAGAYGAGVLRLARRGDHWPVSSTLLFALGLGCVLIGTGYPALAQSAGFEQHAIAHLLVMMAAPTALALGAPIILCLRASRPAFRRKVLRLLHSRPAKVISLAPVVVLLEVSGVSAFYLTPLFAAAEQHALLHLFLHLHMFLCSCLLSWVVLGRDPMPRRGGLTARLSVLFGAAAAHDVMAKLMYAKLLPTGAGSAAQIQTGAQILYYGGDAIELITAAVVMTGWYRRGGRDIRRQERRKLRPHAAAANGN